jgi:hypothetical protein
MARRVTSCPMRSACTSRMDRHLKRRGELGGEGGAGGGGAGGGGGGGVALGVGAGYNEHVVASEGGEAAVGAG